MYCFFGGLDPYLIFEIFVHLESLETDQETWSVRLLYDKKKSYREVLIVIFYGECTNEFMQILRIFLG